MTTTAQPLPVDQNTILDRMRCFMGDSNDMEQRENTLVELLDHAHMAEVIAPGFTNTNPEHAPTQQHVVDHYLDNALTITRNHIRQTALDLQRLSELAWVLGRADIAETLIPRGQRISDGAHQCLRELVTYCDTLGIALPDGDDIDLGRETTT